MTNVKDIVPSKRRALAALAALVAVLLAASLAAPSLANSSSPTQDDEHGDIVIKKQGYLFVGGHYDNPANPTSMSGQMYVEYQIPADKGDPRVTKWPIVMIHGGGHTGESWLTTPDGREGWADYFLRRGWPVYVVDRPGVAKSTSVGAFGNVTNVKTAEDRFVAPEKADPSVQWPQAHLHTQWPGTGTHAPGDPDFDQYYAHLAPSGTASGEDNQVAATIALLEKIGPAILMPHSAPGPGVWRVADTRPDLVKAIVAVEPSGPPFFEAPRFGMPGGELTQPWGVSAGPLAYDPPVTDPSQIDKVQEAAPEGPGLIPCWMQREPARQLPQLAKVPIAFIASEASYHAPYDHCTSNYLTQAGVPNDFIRLASLGLHGNGHIMFVENQHLAIAKVIQDWLTRKFATNEPRNPNAHATKAAVTHHAEHGGARPRSGSPSVGNLHIKDQGAFFVGGQYNDPANPTFMVGQMYVRYQVPSDSTRGKAAGGNRYPIVMIHGGGQQSTTFTGTPDGRPGWADYFLSRGHTVYVVDQPGRGRSPYINSVYGARGTPDIANIENQFTAPERAKLWPQAALHTQWPGTGVHGDPVFDQFFASQFAGMDALSQEKYTTAALVALLDKIGPAILVTHSQSGPHGWETADARPNLVKAMLVVEPNGPPFYNDANTNIDRPWGITRLPLTFSPAANSPADLHPVQEAQAQGPGLYRCWRQGEPARKLPRLAGIPILLVTGEASFRAQYDHCTAQFLSQAGVRNDHVELGDVGIHGNGHMMMLEKNNLRIAGLMERWLRKELGTGMHGRN